jgi:hypothetical protein
VYDPFAQPFTPQAAPAPQTPAVPQVMPNPVPVQPGVLAANNALAAIHQKHMKMMGGGAPGMMDWRALKPMYGDYMSGGAFDQNAFHQARMDWRAQRPNNFPAAPAFGS